MKSLKILSVICDIFFIVCLVLHMFGLASDYNVITSGIIMLSVQMMEAN